VPGNGVTDINGNYYPSIILGNGQEWMTQNLRVANYRNGDAIINGNWTPGWIEPNSSGKWVHYNNDGQYEWTYSYGKLYNWYVISDPRKIAPAGWHVPTKQEWRDLKNYLYQYESEVEPWLLAGGKLKCTGTERWLSPNNEATNEIGFSALPGGHRHGGTGEYQYVGLQALFWTSNDFGNLDAWHVALWNGHGQVIEGSSLKTWGLSIRCVKD
jgi:uncharacterized protein (TIGR02145 family)